MSRYRKYKNKAFKKKADFKKQKKNYFPPTLIVKTGNINDLMLDYEIPSSILNNVWNVHYIKGNKHPQIVTASNNGNVLIFGSTTESKNKHPKTVIPGGLKDGQLENSYLLLNGSVITVGRLQKRLKDHRVTAEGKTHIYENIKNRKSNIINYKDLMKQKKN